MRKPLEERKAARRDKSKKLAPSFGIQPGSQDEKAEMAIVRLLGRQSYLTKRLASIEAKIVAFRHGCKPHKYDTSGRCVKCAGKAPGWVDAPGSELAE